MGASDSNLGVIKLRKATAADLPELNQLIARAVKTWQLPERVIRLALPGYLYSEFDLKHLHIELAQDCTGAIAGLAAWEPAAARDCPPDKRGLLLHGLYVDAQLQRRGIGKHLLAAAAEAARRDGYDGVLVKAQAGAADYFAARGLHALAVQDASRDYADRYWLASGKSLYPQITQIKQIKSNPIDGA